LVHRLLAGQSMNVKALARQVAGGLFGRGRFDKRQFGEKRQREAREKLGEIAQTVDLVERLREALQPLRGKFYRMGDDALKAYAVALRSAGVPDRHARVLLEAYPRGLPSQSVTEPAFRVTVARMGQERDYTRRIFHGFPRLRKALEEAETLAGTGWFVRECKRAFHDSWLGQDRLLSLKNIRALQRAARRHRRTSAQRAAFSGSPDPPEEPR
jgi:hypothetical protein